MNHKRVLNVLMLIQVIRMLLICLISYQLRAKNQDIANGKFTR